MEQLISSYQNESSCQDNLLAVSKHRKIVSKNSKKKICQKLELFSEMCPKWFLKIVKFE